MKQAIPIIALILLFSCVKQRPEPVCIYSVQEFSYRQNGSVESFKEYTSQKPCYKGDTFKESEGNTIKYYTKR